MASDDEYSDLTDISDDDEYRASKSKRKGRASSPRETYRIRDALKTPRATTYTAQALYEQIHTNDIKLDPEYQRDVVWPDIKMVKLIDSVFRNFYIPPVIFSVVTHDDGSEKRICIDGKQRLTSIQRFMDGLIPHHDPHTNQKLWYTAGGKRRDVLPTKFRKLFANKQIVCVEYADLTDSDEREIFQRVQLGMALTPAEKLQVTSTPRATFIRSLLNHFLSPSSSSTMSPDGSGSLAHLDWDRSRGADFRCLAQVVFCMHTYPAFPEPGKSIDPKTLLRSIGGVTQLEKFLGSTLAFTSEFEANVTAALRVLGAMASDTSVLSKGKDKIEIKSVFNTPKKMAPVELVFTGLFVGVHMAAAGFKVAMALKESKAEREEREEREEKGRKKLAEGILLMRVDVRETHVDIRMNTRVAKTMVDFIRSWDPSSPSSTSAATSSTTTSTGKRKRTTGTSDGRAIEDGEVATDDEVNKEDGEIPLRLKFQKTVRSPATPATPSSAHLPPKPLPTPAVPRPDRMAALRAAKLQTLNGGTTRPPLPLPHLPPPPHSAGLQQSANEQPPHSPAGRGQVQSPTVISGLRRESWQRG